MRRIVYISPNGYLGGAERFVLNACYYHLQAKIFSPTIIFFSDGEAAAEARSNGIQVIVLRSKFRLTSPLKLFTALRELRAHLRALTPEWVHNTMPYAHIVHGLAAVGLSYKVAWFQHGPVGGTLDKLASLFKCRLLLFNSKFTMDHHRSTALALRTDRMTVLKLGVLAARTEREIFTKKTVSFGSSGRLCSWKGHEIVLGAIRRLRDEHPSLNFSFRLAGEAKSERDQSYAAGLRRFVEAHDLAPVVQFLGHVRDVSSFYQDLDVFIHSSTIPEPFGLVVAEAQGHSCLVIGSDEGGVADVLIDQRTGLTYAPSSSVASEQLFRILSQLLERFEQGQLAEYRGIAANGREHILREHTLSRMGESIEKLYSE